MLPFRLRMLPLFARNTITILTKFLRLVNQLQNSADQAFQVFPFGMGEVHRVINRMTSPAQKLNFSSCIDCRRKDDLLKKIPMDVMRAGESKEEAFLS